MQMVQVIVPRTTKNYNIIQISFAIIRKTFENFIYEPTERCWRVTETKSHVTPLPVSLRGHKPSQVNMFRGNRYLKIGVRDFWAPPFGRRRLGARTFGRRPFGRRPFGRRHSV